MVRPALLPVAMVVLLALAGCSAAIPGSSPATPADIEPRVVSQTASGGECVENPMNGFDIESSDTNGVLTVTVAANVTVPGAHHQLEDASVTRTGDTTFRLDVNTTESTEKPEKPCENGGIVHYEVTLEVPATQRFELTIRHNGHTVSGIGSGGSAGPNAAGGSGAGAGAET